VEEIAAHGDSCAVGVLLLWAIVDTDFLVCDLMFVIVRNVFAADENDSVGTFADSGHALSETPEFLRVGFAPQFLVIRVHKEVPHFHEMARGFVKDSMEHVEGYCCCAARQQDGLLLCHNGGCRTTKPLELLYGPGSDCGCCVQNHSPGIPCHPIFPGRLFVGITGVL
jgi:hypothetical protein